MPKTVRALTAALVLAVGPAAASAAPVDQMVVAARTVYANEVGGGRTISVLHEVGSDATLLRLLKAHELRAARAYVARKFPRVWYHWHVSRMRITHGSRPVTEVGVPFVVAPSSMTLTSGGQPVGRLEVSMQDEIGFVRLMRRRYPSLRIVVRGGRPGELATSLPAATRVRLPHTGAVAIGGARYDVRSFSEPAWNGETVTISLLMRR